MASPLNKTALEQRRDQLALYQRFLPSLDLKRQQLIADMQRAQRELQSTEREIEALLGAQTGLFALLGASKQDMRGLVSVESVVIDEENVLGVKLPVLRRVAFRRSDYSMLTKPFWADFLVELLEAMAELHIRARIQRRRLAIFAEAVRRTTQRVNLFGQILIPEAEKDVHRIRVFLADAERAAVVRSKIAKAKRNRVTTPTEAG